MTRKNENSGLIDLDALLRDANHPVPPASLDAEEPALAEPIPVAPETKPSRLEYDSLEALTTEPPTERPRREAREVPPLVTPSRGNRHLAVATALVVAALGVAGIVLRPRASPSVGTAVATAAPPTTTPGTERTEAPSMSVVEGLRADTLPAARAASASSVGHAPRVAGGGAKPRSAPAPASTLTEAMLEARGPSAAGSLGDAMRGAVGAQSGAPVSPSEAATVTSATQIHPSPGAVIGALGSVLPEARACLSPDAAVRTGVVVFRSDGRVARIELNGSKPEDECVRAALAKAKVAPFVEETFATRVTVRP